MSAAQRTRVNDTGHIPEDETTGGAEVTTDEIETLRDTGVTATSPTNGDRELDGDAGPRAVTVRIWEQVTRMETKRE